MERFTVLTTVGKPSTCQRSSGIGPNEVGPSLKGSFWLCLTPVKKVLDSKKIDWPYCTDVGAGSGILSLFCMRAGARRVYAVEACPGMARPLQEVITTNGGGDVVKVIASRVEVGIALVHL